MFDAVVCVEGIIGLMQCYLSAKSQLHSLTETKQNGANMLVYWPYPHRGAFDDNQNMDSSAPLLDSEQVNLLWFDLFLDSSAWRTCSLAFLFYFFLKISLSAFSEK